MADSREEVIRLLTSIDRRLQTLEERGIAQAAPMAADGFARFWDAYPRKDDKAKASKVWNKLAPAEPLVQQILEALAWQRPHWAKDENRFVPLPTTYLNNRRWEDERRESPLLEDDERVDPKYDTSRPYQPSTKPLAGGW